MSRPSYSVLTAAVILTTALLTQVVQGDDQAASQAVRPATASTSITPEQAAPFVGNWLVTLSMGANNVSVAVAVTADAGKVAAIVTSDAQQTTNVTDISLAGKSLVLKYVTSMQGTPLSNVMTLTPDAAGMRANLAVMDGQYEMPGTAAKQAPVNVSIGDKSVQCTLRDRMPWKKNIKNGAIIDLNPDAVRALGLEPPIMAEATWAWA